MALTLGQARPKLAPYVDNGQPTTDPRVMARIDEAQQRLYPFPPFLGVMGRWLLTPQTVEDGKNIYILPASIGTVSRVGSSSVVAPNGTLLADDETAFIFDTPVVDIQWMQTLPDRRFKVLTDGVTNVEVQGKKALVSLTNDSDELLIQDIPALKLVLLAIWRENNDQLELSNAHFQSAVSRMSQITSEAIDRARRRMFQSNHRGTYGTFGWVRERLILDLQMGIHDNDTIVYDLLNKAIDLLVQYRNFLNIEGRLGARAGAPLEVYTPLKDDNAVLPVKDYNTIKLMVMAMVAANSGEAGAMQTAPALEQQAYGLLEQNLRTELAAKRFTQYQADFVTHQATPDTLGHVRARLALDLPQGLFYSDEEMTRLINEAYREAVDYYNFIGRREDYDAALVFEYTTDAGFRLPFSYEIIKLLVQAQLTDVGTSQALKDTAFGIVQRDLVTRIENERKAQHQGNVTSLAPTTFGHFVARLGLELPGGLALPPAELERLINQAEEWAMSMGQYRGTVENFRFSTDKSAIISVPSDVESILFAAIGGRGVPVYDGSHDFTTNGPGYQIEGRSGGAMLIDRGEKDGRRLYFVSGVCADEGTCVHIRAKLRFKNHTAGIEKMRITNFPAIRRLVEGLLSPDPNFQVLAQREALAILDRELAEHSGGARTTLQIEDPASLSAIPALR